MGSRPFPLHNLNVSANAISKTCTPDKYVVRAADSNLYPYLLVNIGSGVPLLKGLEDGQRSFPTA